MGLEQATKLVKQAMPAGVTIFAVPTLLFGPTKQTLEAILNILENQEERLVVVGKQDHD
jgi:electron transfer flavoprotein alpha/beta subunit